MTDDAILQAEQDVRTADRAAAAPYLDYPDEPWWYPVAFGAWFALLVTAYGLLRDETGVLLAAIAVLFGVELLFLRWAAARHGALPFPGHGTPPAEIGALQRRCFGGAFVVLVVVVSLFALAGWVVAAILAFALVAGGYVAYARAYGAAADAARARLA